jgi:polyisoprenoid-binding protein YceI
MAALVEEKPMTKILSVVLCSAALSCAAGEARAAVYTIDPAHSSVSFSVRHLVTKVRGSFDKFAGTVEYEPGKARAWKTAVEIDPASIDTKVGPRDSHLKSPDFFDVAKCPKMSFTSTKIVMNGDTGKMTGDLTMHCVTKPVTLDLAIGGLMKDAGGKEHLGASATGTLDRKDWNLTWNKAVEAGKLMVGDEVSIELDIEALPGGEPAKAAKAPKGAARK